MPRIKVPKITKFSQKQKILVLMCRNPKKWFYPYEFMTPDLDWLFVGYKAPTRLSELDNQYPGIFDKKSEDKYMQRRLNVKEIDKWYPYLKAEHKAIINANLTVGDL